MIKAQAQKDIENYMLSPFWGISGLIRLLNDLSDKNELVTTATPDASIDKQSEKIIYDREFKSGELVQENKTTVYECSVK